MEKLFQSSKGSFPASAAIESAAFLLFMNKAKAVPQSGKRKVKCSATLEKWFP